MDTNIKYYGMYALMKDEIILTRSIQETLRIVDAKEAEKQYGIEKLGYRYEFVDKEA